MLGRPKLKLSFLHGYLHRELVLRAGRHLLCRGLAFEQLAAKLPRGHGRTVYISTGKVEPFVYVGVETDACRLAGRVAYGDVNLKHSFRH